MSLKQRKVMVCVTDNIEIDILAIIKIFTNYSQIIETTFPKTSMRCDANLIKTYFVADRVIRFLLSLRSLSHSLRNYGFVDIFKEFQA